MTEDFFKFEGPVLESETEDMLARVLKGYGNSVVAAIKEVAMEHMDDCVALVNICFPGMQTVLARQRRDYGLSEEFPAQYPVFDQCSNPDDTPVNNIAMERQCGTVDYRLHKLQKLTSVSRSMILDKRKEVSDGKESSFRSFKEQVELKKKKFLWSGMRSSGRKWPLGSIGGKLWHKPRREKGWTSWRNSKMVVGLSAAPRRSRSSS